MRLIPLIMVMFLWSPTILSSQDLGFTGHYLYQSPSSRIFAVTSGDLDHDSLKDIVFTEPDADLLQWLKNEGNGQFSLHTAGAFRAIGAQVLDFDGNGTNDIVACSYDLNLVAVFLNDGNENFIMDTVSVSVTHPLVVSAGDIDGDGDCDIAVATQDAGTGAVLLLNNGDMNFTASQLDNQSYSCTWVEMVDLDQDDTLDVVATNFSGTGGLIWYEQTSALNFARHFISFPNAHGCATGDLDGDGDPDLAAASCGSKLAWFENDGSNDFSVHTVYSGYNCAVSVGIADFDNDLKNDIGAVAWGSHRVDWWKNNGDQSFTRKMISDTLHNPSDLCLTDLGNDGYPDVLTGSYVHTLAWFENNGQYVGTGTRGKKEPFTLITDPRNNLVKVRWDPFSGDAATIEVFNILGERITPVLSRSHDEPVTVKLPSSGLYLLKIRAGGEIFINKIVLP